MLSCKKCGAAMSGVDLVCKKCGTPWGKTGKSKAPLFFSILLVILISLTVLYFTNKELFAKILPLDYFKQNISQPNNNEDINNVPNNVLQEPPVEPPAEPDIPVEPSEENKPEIIPPPVFTIITASSNLPSQGNFKYTPDMVTDSNNSTAWLEGAKVNGINEWLQFSADTEQTVNGIKIFNGYQKNNITYINNSRLKKIKIEFSDKTSIDYDIPSQSYDESLNGIDIPFEAHVKTSIIKITILDVYKGTYYTDAAVNEIQIY